MRRAIRNGSLCAVFIAAVTTYDRGWRAALPLAVGGGALFGVLSALLDAAFDWFGGPRTLDRRGNVSQRTNRRER